MPDREFWQQIAQRYADAFGGDLCAVAAFGSRARGGQREDSDHDILLVARGLSRDVFEQNRQLRDPLRGLRASMVQVLARTPEEFLRDVTPLHLDLALDAIILDERDAFLSGALSRVRELLDEAGLYRMPNLFWRWKKPPRRDWAIHWEGVRI